MAARWRAEIRRRILSYGTSQIRHNFANSRVTPVRLRRWHFRPRPISWRAQARTRKLNYGIQAQVLRCIRFRATVGPFAASRLATTADDSPAAGMTTPSRFGTLQAMKSVSSPTTLTQYGRLLSLQTVRYS